MLLSLYPGLFWELRGKSAIFYWKPRSHVRILIYQTWLISGKIRSWQGLIASHDKKYRLFWWSRVSFMPYLDVFNKYLPTQIRYLIGGKRAPCHGSKPTWFLRRIKLTNSLGKRHLNLQLHVIKSRTLKQRHICLPAGVKQIIFFPVFSTLLDSDLVVML